MTGSSAGALAAVADTHAPVLALEAVHALNIRADGTYVDCTFGRGGHSALILERLGNTGRLFGLDRDGDAIAAGAPLAAARRG